MIESLVREKILIMIYKLETLSAYSYSFKKKYPNFIRILQVYSFLDTNPYKNG
jgi:hypothetical protein